MINHAPFLFVDLDHTLLKTDVFKEQLVQLFLTKPSVFIKILWLLVKGQKFEAKILAFEHTYMDVKYLPYRREMLDLIHEYKKSGATIILATATVKEIAQKVADHLGVFDKVLASDIHNLKGQEKLKEIQKVTKGEYFDYAGDCSADLPIWEKSNTAIVVGSKGNTLQKRLDCNKARLVDNKTKTLKMCLKALRLHQWAKNILIFLPLLASHHVSYDTVIPCVIAFFCFSFLASCIYVINDLCDLVDDRRHPKKSQRPFASGELDITHGLFLSLLLLSISLFLVFLLPVFARWVVFVYFCITNVYSFYAKTLPIVDVFLLSLLYTVRVILGHEVVFIHYSPWLLAFCTIFFLGLAFAKRTSETFAILHQKQKAMSRRGYKAEDYYFLMISGLCASISSVVVFMLYINSDAAKTLYKAPAFLWPVSLLILFWNVRVWFLTNRGEMHYDPVVFALKDRVSYGIGVAMVILFLMAMIAL